jgi:hypothetical protein
MNLMDGCASKMIRVDFVANADEPGSGGISSIIHPRQLPVSSSGAAQRSCRPAALAPDFLESPARRGSSQPMMKSYLRVTLYL